MPGWRQVRADHRKTIGRGLSRTHRTGVAVATKRSDGPTGWHGRSAAPWVPSVKLSGVRADERPSLADLRSAHGSGRGGGNAGALCMVAAVAFSVNYFYYILSPKSDWMVLHLKSGEETQAWLKVYRTMQFNYHLGLVLGIIAVVAFGNALCG